MAGNNENNQRAAEEALPLLSISATRPYLPVVHAKSFDPVADHVRSFQEQQQQKMMREQQQMPPKFHRKYLSYPVGNARKGSRKNVAVYGTMPTTSATQTTVRKAPRNPEDCDPIVQYNSPHSETDSDSDGSCTGSTISSTSSLQSILRIRDGEAACRSVKKNMSVEFALDVYDDDADDDDDPKIFQKSRSCSSRCLPRRLTIEEKAALYRIRPDLELTPAPILLHELEELRRRRQRKVMFSLLSGSLLLFMVVVFYYLATQM